MPSSPCSRIEQENGLRVRPPQVVRFDTTSRHTRFPLFRLDRHRRRINKFQRKWEHIKEDLPPQLSPRHIGMISIGGVIGTGLFLGSAYALESGGPVGALLAYLVIGVVVYALCVSVGEMVAYLPNVGGVVGITDLYVDPALGFSLGWAAWLTCCSIYQYTACEITAATVVVQFWDPDQKYIAPPVLAGVLLFLAVLVNCFSSRVYGELEFWFSTLKVIIIIIIIVACLILDVVGKRVDNPNNEWPSPIGFHTWRKSPFALNYMDISGFEGQFLGFLTVLIQATFSFFGSEVPGIAAGEVIDARRNVPRALRRVWIRLTLFYLGGIFCVGLLVDAKDLKIARASDPPGGPTGRSSPFVVAFGVLGVKVLPHIVNAAILISTWSAATSQIYISSRFLFFLARRGHAPAIFGTLTKFPSDTTQDQTHQRRAGESHPTGTQRSVGSLVPRDILSRTMRDDSTLGNLEAGSVDGGSNNIAPPRPATTTKGPHFILPLASVLGSASVSVFCFLGLRDLSKITSEGTTPVSRAIFDVASIKVYKTSQHFFQALSFRTFTLLVSISSVASLQSWAGILFTYIRLSSSIVGKTQCRL
ncbi:hypothetical protein NLI96_g6668 [Meripilus lineatus]|uniref:Amino acid permease/ SLC12A domain-containing protein n=1 Tax=Meripilus lineatus TaxID=2056292 RepID=A0AAD5YCR5_9APHY|nr:hypothetical protein NLI96_g6668 [Physisporinus lineatus]